MASAPLPPAWPDRLVTADLLRELSPAARATMIGCASRRAAARREQLFAAGDPAETLWVVVDGQVKLLRRHADGQEIILRYVGRGGLLGAVAALPRATYPATAEVADDAELAAWDRTTLLARAHEYPEIHQILLGLVSDRMREVQGQLQEVATERVAQRLARALLRLARQTGRKTDEGILLDLPLSRQDLAELTGTTLFTVSRQLSAWEAAGLLVAGRERIVIRAAHGLVRIAEDLP